MIANPTVICLGLQGSVSDQTDSTARSGPQHKSFSSPLRSGCTWAHLSPVHPFWQLLPGWCRASTLEVLLQELIPQLAVVQARAGSSVEAVACIWLAERWEFAVEKVQLCLPLKAVFAAPIPKAFAAPVVCQVDGGAACVVHKGG